MSQILKKYFVPLNLLILTTGIFFITQIITFKMANRLEPPFSMGLPTNVSDSGKKEIKPFDAYKAILARNIFNSKSLSALTAPPVSPTTPPVEEKPPIPIRLMGTVAGSPPYAYAIIEDPFQKINKIFRLDDTVAQGVKLLEIHRNRIIISRDGKREEIEMAVQETGAPRVSSPPRITSSVPMLPPTEINEVSPNSFVVDKETIEKATQDMNTLLTQARIVPNFTGGAADGFRIFSIVPNSLFSKAGLRNGDIIHSINGMELKEPEKAFQVYQTLKDNDRVVMDVVRAGQRMTLNYEVR